MKLVGTRIRVEKSDLKTEYFPEYCVETEDQLSLKQEWKTAKDGDPFYFGQAVNFVSYGGNCVRRSEEWARDILDYQKRAYQAQLDIERHHKTKEVSYIEYP